MARTATAWAVASICAAVATAGCGPEAAEDAEPGVSLGTRGDAEVGGRVVSTVNGHPITLEEVERAARSARVAPRVALRRLQDEALLASAAAHAGFEDDPAVERVGRQAMVQALLARTIEQELTADAIDPAALEAAWTQDPARWHRPERRETAHALARVPAGAPPAIDAAAREWAQRIHDEVAASDDPLAAILAVRRRPPEDRPFEVTVEEVPGLAGADAADRAYLDAIFALDGEGLVPAPVRSAFGWHVIVVTDVDEAEHVDRDEALSILRAERLAALRAAALEERVRAMGRERGVEVVQENVRRYFADESLWGGAR